MVGWLYIEDTVAAPIRVLEIDSVTGLLTLEVASKFLPNRSELRGQTIVEFRSWKRRRIVRCLGAEEVGGAMMIEAVDLGLADPEEENDDPRGMAEDWLVVDGRARCRVSGFKQGHCPGSITSHCLMHVDLADWRDLRVGEGAALASIGIEYDEAGSADGSITPMLHATRESSGQTPHVEVVRLRERARYTVLPMATDWGEHSTLVISRVLQESPLTEARVGVEV